MDRKSFGYPQLDCKLCESYSTCSPSVDPFYQPGSKTRLMIIGQDPTIYNGPERVKVVLMLDDKNSKLSIWLRDMFGKDIFDKITIYATNAVKCFLPKPPSSNKANGYKVLKPYFNNCKNYLLKEILTFKPSIVITLGEPAHKLFIQLISNDIKEKMNDAFTGDFIDCSIDDVNFKYSPCLHITTFRIAETYGNRISKYKDNLRNSVSGT